MAGPQQDRLCTFLIDYGKSSNVNVAELKQRIMNNDEGVKIEAMKHLLHCLANGERLPQLLMPVIQYIVPSRNHVLKKLALLYWELVDKKSPDGKLLPEMILVINFLRFDLNSPNEYVRGATLRLLSKIRSPEILLDLMTSIVACLEHRHSYVRRSAVIAVHTIFRSYPQLVPDAPEQIERLLSGESDVAAKRNAFTMLFECAPEKAAAYILSLEDTVPTLGEVLQLVLVDAMRKFCKAGHPSKQVFLKMLFKLLGSDSSAVLYQCATTIISLSGSPTAVKAAARTFTALLQRESDNNIRLILLDRLSEMKEHHPHVLEELIMDILAALEIPNTDVRRRCLAIALDLVGSGNVDEVVQFLKKLLVKSLGPDADKNPEYLKLVVEAVGSCINRFPETAETVVHVLMDYLTDVVSHSVSVEVISFIRSVVEQYPHLRPGLVEKLRLLFSGIGSARVFRTSLWILGDYSETLEDVVAGLDTVVEALGTVPFLGGGGETRLSDLASNGKTEDDRMSVLSSASARASGLHSSATTASVTTRINADGTYATQFSTGNFDGSAGAAAGAAKDGGTSCKLRGLMLAGDYYLVAVLASTLTKFSYLLDKHRCEESLRRKYQAQVMLVITSLLRYGKHEDTKPQMDDDSFDRVAMCLQLCTHPTPQAAQLILDDSRKVFAKLLSTQKQERELMRQRTVEQLNTSVPVEQCISFRLLKAGRGAGADVIGAFDDEDAMGRTFGSGEEKGGQSGLREMEWGRLKFEHVVQLTGFADPVYAEATVTTNQYDILVDLLVINQTGDTLDNLTLDLSTTGDLKICDKPPTISLGPHQKKEVRASVKVSSTDNGSIFGNIVYDQVGTGPTERKTIVLNDIHLDIMDYIEPRSCSEMQFRSMWAEFEWENKVTINSDFVDLLSFLHHMMTVTKMKCLTEDAAIGEDCPFLSANLYAKSVFGEDALANVSVEKVGQSVVGYIRIRSKTQGIALALGERITSKQRSTSAASPAGECK